MRKNGLDRESVTHRGFYFGGLFITLARKFDFLRKLCYTIYIKVDKLYKEVNQRERQS